VFEKILFKPSGLLGRGVEVDFGEIAEAMVFYGRVHLALDEGALRSLVRRVGIDDLITLAGSGNLQISVFRDVLATHETNGPAGRFYEFISVEPLRSDKTEREPREIIQSAFLAGGEKPGKSRRAAQRFLDRCTVESINEGVSHELGIPELSREDLRDSRYVEKAIEAALGVMAPGYRLPWEMQFRLDQRENGFRLQTNLDIAAINRAHLLAFPGSDADITFALLLDAIHGARGDLFLAARHSAELVTSRLSSAVISERLRLMASRLPESRLDQARLFQEEVLAISSVREVINRKERTVRELLELVEAAERFRDWLREAPADGRLIREYVQAISAESWLDRLPIKSLRYIIFTAAGAALDALVFPGLGALLGLGDTFMLDKLGRGWRPNQFVDDDLARFLRPGSSAAPGTRR
jgi:hypothetical protein